MAIKFAKMHGLGNDFVVIDTLRQAVHLTKQSIQQMADRHKGIGFDQLLLIESSQLPNVDFAYRIFNADGSEVEQCGNGARCIARYLIDQQLTSKKEINVSTLGGELRLILKENGLVTVNMGVPNFDPKNIPLDVAEQNHYYHLSLEGEEIQFGAVSLGNPHAVIIVSEVQKAPVAKVGAIMQQQACFPKQVNVGFLQILDSKHVKLRVFERGAGETLACGSGACAAVAVARKRGLLDSEVKVDLPGGQLQVMWRSDKDPMYLTGPTKTIFLGEWLE